MGRIVAGNHRDPPHRPVLFRIFLLEMHRSATNRRTAILLADSQVMVRDLLARWLRSIPGFDVAGVLGEAGRLTSETDRLRPDVVLLDAEMPELDVVEAARTIQARCPETRIILLIACRGERCLQQTLAAGVAGYVTRNDPPDALVRAIRGAVAGQPCYSREISTSRDVTEHGPASRPWPDSGEPRLSQRELEVLRYLATGLSKKEIAQFMHISANTVNRHTDNLMAKLDIHDRVRLTRYAMQEGLLESQAS
jgi:DNA-binding NarL/FixJ family response regulator